MIRSNDRRRLRRAATSRAADPPSASSGTIMSTAPICASSP
jgi:hypothetical protein